MYLLYAWSHAALRENLLAEIGSLHVSEFWKVTIWVYMTPKIFNDQIMSFIVLIYLSMF